MVGHINYIFYFFPLARVFLHYIFWIMNYIIKTLANI